MDKTIAIIDLKSFYASCECAVRHLDPFKTPLVCCDPYRSSSSVVMSVTPYLKEKYGVPNVCRRRDLPDIKGLIFAVPRMSYYLEVSSKVLSIFLDYVSIEDIHIYSVDESFLDLTPYLDYYHLDAETLVKKIQKDINEKLGLIATAGIAPNPFLAKIALDQEGKKKPPYLAHWDQKDVQTKLWKISPLSKIWSIGERTEKNLKAIGIRSVKELAVADPKLLEKSFGIIGLQLKQLANGIDESDFRDPYVPKDVSLSLGQTLISPHTLEETYLLFREMNDDLSNRLRKQKKQAGKISVYIGYNNGESYAHQESLPFPTKDTTLLYRYLKKAIDYGATHQMVRGISISYGKLVDDYGFDQLSLLENEKIQAKRLSIDKTLDEIQSIYGKNSVLRASSLTKGSTIKIRHEQIGGHKK